MTKTALPLAATLAAFCLSVSAAQATGVARAWVSGHGSDAAGCGSPASPCRSLQYVHDNIVAAGGEIDILDPAGYGAVTITKALSIVNDGGGTAGVQSTSGNAVTVNAGPNDVVLLRGLDIEGVGTGLFGVYTTTFGALHIENCRVSNFIEAGVNVSASAAGAVYVNDTIVRGNGYGFSFTTSSPPLSVSIDNTRSEGNNIIGIFFGSDVVATVSRTVASGSGSSGFNLGSFTGHTGELNCYRCVASNNVRSGFLTTGSGASTLRVSQSTATDNGEAGFSNFGGDFETFGTNMVRGNSAGTGGPQTTGVITAISQE